MTYTAEVYYLTEHGENPVIVATPDDIDTVVDDLLTQPASNQYATLFIRERPTNAKGFPDHELAIAVDPDAKVGALIYLGPDGVWASKGDARTRDDVRYYYMGNDREFPTRSEVTLDLIRQAAKQFLTTGGERPTATEWQDRD